MVYNLIFILESLLKVLVSNNINIIYYCFSLLSNNANIIILIRFLKLV